MIGSPMGAAVFTGGLTKRKCIAVDTAPPRADAAAVRSMKLIFSILPIGCATALGQAAEPAKLKLHWAKNMLTISGDHLPGKEMKIHYLEAYCRDNSQTTDWGRHTVVGHKTRLVSRSEDGSQL
ncbi:MAG: hypothetical protein VYC47_06695, partial [Verrucomicrobiota bacterium]|nr:hypothetical protein [Verrucomicrobiota bacterium]